MAADRRSTQAPTAPATGEPVVREEDGGLSLDFDDGTVQSRMRRAAPTELVLEYTRLMMGFLLFRPAPARIAMIGLGGGSLAKYCARALPAADFTAVELSPQVIALRDQFGIPADGRRFRVRGEDGAAFVRRAGAGLDVLLVDGFDRRGQPEELCGPAFYDACRDRLAPGGVLVVNLHSDEADCGRCIEQIHASFAGRIVVVQADASENTVVFGGTEGTFPPSFGDLVERLRGLAAAHPIGLDVTLQKILQYRPSRAGGRPRRRRR